MSELDETDLELLRLLLADARRPYSDLAEQVDLSAPTVSDRVDRLVERGVIERFTVDVNHSALAGGVPVLVELRVRPGREEDVRRTIEGVPEVEHVFVTADARIVVTATVDESDVRETLLSDVPDDAIVEYDARLLADESWNPVPPDVSLATACDECGNTVTSEGESLRLDDRRYQFCCPSCRSRFEERYERLSESATD